MTDGSWPPSDHDLLIRLDAKITTFLEYSSLDRTNVHIELGKLQQAVYTLQQQSATMHGGWKVVVVIGAVFGAILGFLGHLFGARL